MESAIGEMQYQARPVRRYERVNKATRQREAYVDLGVSFPSGPAEQRAAPALGGSGRRKGGGGGSKGGGEGKGEGKPERKVKLGAAMLFAHSVATRRRLFLPMDVVTRALWKRREGARARRSFLVPDPSLTARGTQRLESARFPPAPAALGEAAWPAPRVDAAGVPGGGAGAAEGDEGEGGVASLFDPPYVIEYRECSLESAYRWRKPVRPVSQADGCAAASCPPLPGPRASVDPRFGCQAGESGRKRAQE